MVNIRIIFWLSAFICCFVSIHNLLEFYKIEDTRNEEVIQKMTNSNETVEVINHSKFDQTSDMNTYFLNTLDIITSKNKKELKTKLEAFDICRKLGVKYIDATKSKIKNTINNENLLKLKRSFYEIEWDENDKLGTFMVDLSCNTGTIVWLSYTRSETKRKISKIIDTKIKEIIQGT